jgi:hypothetical protein
MDRDERIRYLEMIGALCPECPGCQSRYDAEDASMVMAPSHRAKPNCQSGGRHHCTCDTCF